MLTARWVCHAALNSIIETGYLKVKLCVCIRIPILCNNFFFFNFYMCNETGQEINERSSFSFLDHKSHQQPKGCLRLFTVEFATLAKWTAPSRKTRKLPAQVLLRFLLVSCGFRDYILLVVCVIEQLFW